MNKTDITNKLLSLSSPDRFKWIYLSLAFSCLLLILCISFAVIRNQSNRDLNDHININAQKITDALFYTEVEDIWVSGPPELATLAIPAERINRLKARTRDLFDQMDVLEVAIFSRDGTILYANDTSSIGRAPAPDPMLKEAISGRISSRILENQEHSDLIGSRQLHAYISESWVPVRGKNGSVIGVFKICCNISKIKADYRDQIRSSSILLLIGILFISLLSFLVIVKASAELKNAYILLETVATTDSLTGIFNRRHLLERADEMFSLMQRTRGRMADDAGLGLVMLDIDHFKNINDTHGHLAGDEIIREMARRIDSTLRDYDIFGRYGGEEFLVVLANITPDEVERIAARMLDAAASEPFSANGVSIRVTLSLGAFWTDTADRTLDAELNRADALLYEAKRNGRNRVVFGRC